MLDKNTQEWIDSCNKLTRFDVIIPPNVQIACMVYVDKYGRTLTDNGVGPIIHSILYTDISEEKSEE